MVWLGLVWFDFSQNLTKPNQTSDFEYQEKTKPNDKFSKSRKNQTKPVIFKREKKSNQTTNFYNRDKTKPNPQFFLEKTRKKPNRKKI